MVSNHYFLFTQRHDFHGMIRIRMVEELKADHAKQMPRSPLAGRKRAPSDWPRSA